LFTIGPCNLDLTFLLISLLWEIVWNFILKRRKDWGQLLRVNDYAL
jgi:hypothetical protein